MTKRTLPLDRTKSNPAFDSWKLSRALTVSKHVVTLRGSVSVCDHSTDYLNTRAAILHNHIHDENFELLLITTSLEIDFTYQVVFDKSVHVKNLWGRLASDFCSYLTTRCNSKAGCFRRVQRERNCQSDPQRCRPAALGCVSQGLRQISSRLAGVNWAWGHHIDDI